MRLAAVGDVGVDVYENLGAIHVGGISINVALSASELGVDDVFLYSALGDDYGDFVQHAIATTPVHFRGRRLAGKCSTQHLVVHPDGNREFTGYYPNVLGEWRLTPEELAELATMDVICAPVSDGLYPVAEQVIPLETGALKAIDFSEDGEWWGPEYFERFVPFLGIAFFGVKTGVPPSVPELARRYPEKVFVVTEGPLGSTAFHGECVARQPARPTTVVDTCGCGDAFQAGFIVEWLGSRDLARALEAGTAQAGNHMQHYGSNALRQTLRIDRN